MINYVNITCIIFSTRTFLVFDTSLYTPPPLCYRLLATASVIKIAHYFYIINFRVAKMLIMKRSSSSTVCQRPFELILNKSNTI
ncbi:ALH_1b_G0025420.mRNA.1.CDS.1 [Saccharomyces cerevisiae]|nr:ALH_1c_G0025320.mRNA.1.CDS.1 [Saccharomyces cerevisiae]CAI4549117.1 ALH_1b_G0025420.mRNA.1.CDS.1 [Saccharomyces cerevisiae]CAI5265280.1 AKR_HP2_G0024530.mRNA.1.CDS.1 [Saccharomyces cerevisiae]CAI6482011.1 AKR_HP2_G0024530.mRNA.1.CDS.1 [Saccharomyces cerevisiae]CAI6491973.1 AKR_HP1_G0024650.mRNA.1.CDS.1 [Saccharomyces cerevisiae]